MRLAIILALLLVGCSSESPDQTLNDVEIMGVKHYRIKSALKHYYFDCLMEYRLNSDEHKQCTSDKFYTWWKDEQLGRKRHQYIKYERSNRIDGFDYAIIEWLKEPSQ